MTGIKGQALRPDTFTLTDYIKEPKREPDVAELTNDEKILAQGAEMEFWRIVKSHIENEVRKLDAINDIAINNGMSLEEIGRNTIVISQVKAIVNKIVNVVQDASDAKNGK